MATGHKSVRALTVAADDARSLQLAIKIFDRSSCCDCCCRVCRAVPRSCHFSIDSIRSGSDAKCGNGSGFGLLLLLLVLQHAGEAAIERGNHAWPSTECHDHLSLRAAAPILQPSWQFVARSGVSIARAPVAAGTVACHGLGDGSSPRGFAPRADDPYLWFAW